MSALEPGPEEAVPAWAIRLEAKVDVALARHGDRLSAHEREIREIREEATTTRRELNGRLLTLERAPSVTPKQLGATVLGAVTAMAAVVPLLDRIYT